MQVLLRLELKVLCNCNSTKLAATLKLTSYLAQT